MVCTAPSEVALQTGVDNGFTCADLSTTAELHVSVVGKAPSVSHILL